MELKCYSLLVFALATIIMAHGNSDHGNHEHDDHSCTNKYSEGCNKDSTDDAANPMFEKGHLKPFGLHRPPDAMVEELKYSISPQDFYMNYVVHHKPVVLKGTLKQFCNTAACTNSDH